MVKPVVGVFPESHWNWLEEVITHPRPAASVIPPLVRLRVAVGVARADEAETVTLTCPSVSSPRGPETPPEAVNSKTQEEEAEVEETTEEAFGEP